MELDSLRAKLDSPEALSFVKKRLSRISEVSLPENGIVCGQAVTSAIVEYLGLQNEITPVYNDVDVFIPFSLYNLSHIDSMTSASSSGKSMSIGTSSDTTLSTDISGGYQYITYSTADDYTIERSVSIGNLNKTFIFVPKMLQYERWSDVGYYNYAATKVLSSFDINSTQAAFVLGEQGRQLIYTSEFLEFLVTKELLITNWNTPLHSLIRFGRKKTELDVYGDVGRMQHVAMSYASILSKIKTATASDLLAVARNGSEMNRITPLHDKMLHVPLEFGKKQKDAFLENKALFSGLNIKETASGIYTLEPERPIRCEILLDQHLTLGGDMLYGSTFDNGCYDDLRKMATTGHIPLGKHMQEYSGKMVNHFEADYINEIETVGSSFSKMDNAQIGKFTTERYTKAKQFDTHVATLLRLPKLFHGLTYSRKSSKSIVRETLKEDFLRESHSGATMSTVEGSLRRYVQSPTRMIEALHKNTSNELVLYSKYKKILFRDGQHPYLAEILENSGLSTGDKGEAMKRIHEFSRDDMGIIGELETGGAQFYAYGGVSGIVHGNTLQEYSNWKKRENDEPLLPEGLSFDFENDSYGCTLLNSKNALADEGKALNHCVGGYSDKVSAGNALIYSFVPKNKEGARCTMELCPTRSRGFESSPDEVAFSVNQVKGKRNISVPLDHGMAEIFKEIHKQHPFLPANGNDDASKMFIGNFLDEDRSMSVLRSALGFPEPALCIRSTLHYTVDDEPEPEHVLFPTNHL